MTIRCKSRRVQLEYSTLICIAESDKVMGTIVLNTDEVVDS